MANTSRVLGPRGARMAMGYGRRPRATSTRGTGRTIGSMDRGSSSTRIVSIKANSRASSSGAMGSRILSMATSMRGSMLAANLMATASIDGPMAIFMRGTSRMA